MNKFKDFIICSFENEEEAIEFLNTTAYDIYSLKSKFKLKLVSTFKSTILKGMNFIERIIRGTFNCDLFLKNIDIDLFSQMFPLISGESMFNLTDIESVKNLGRVLETFRNSNAHIVVANKNLKTLSTGFEFLENQPKILKTITYSKDGAITAAGIIFIMMSLLNQRYIKTLSNNEWVLGLVTCGEYRRDDGDNFVQNISHVNLEVPIRQKSGDDVATSLLGEYIDKFEITPDKYKDIVIEIGAYNPTYRLKCSISDELVHVKSGSLTKAAYHEDYDLKIIEKEAFIKYANMVPPFTFVDYLYELGITCFDNNTIKIVEENFESILKMNKSKLYGDKNIKILQLGSKWADFRLVAEIFTSSVMNITLGLSSLVRVKKRYNPNYSENLSDILDSIEVPEDSKDLLINMRNFAVHGYMIDDCFLLDNSIIEYSFDNVIKSMCLLAKHIMTMDDQMQRFIKREIMNNLIRTTMNGKFKLANKRTTAYINDPSESNLEDLNKAVAWIKNSGFDVNLFEPLLNILNDHIQILSVRDETRNVELYFPGTTTSQNDINEYISNNNLMISQQIDEPLKTFITLKKKK